MRVNEKFMQEVGLGAMPEAERKAFMNHAEEELEVRVGQGIGEFLTEELLVEFEGIDDLDAAAVWLEKYVPNFREVVTKICDDFKAEIKMQAPEILGEATQ